MLFNLLLTLALVRRLNNTSPNKDGIEPVTGLAGLKPGQRAPDFTAETLDSNQISLSHYAGHSVAFVFVATSCEPCREALPGYEALRPKAERAGVHLVLVSVDNQEQTRSLVDEFNIRMPVLVASRADNSFMQDYGLSGTPSYCFLDGEGIVQSSGYPSPKWGEWKKVIESWGGEETGNKLRVADLATTEGR
jgi:peroxiredoxin